MALVFDIETNALELDKITTIHSFVIRDDNGIVISAVGNEQAKQAADILSKYAGKIVGHNILRFDIPAIKKITGVDLWNKNVYDTLLMSRLIFTDVDSDDFKFIKSARGKAMPLKLVGSHSLEAWGYRLGMLKGEFGKTADWSNWSREMQEYCERDVEVCRSLYQKFVDMNYSADAEELEHEFARVIYRMSDRGFCFDESKAADLYAVLLGERESIKSELAKVFGSTYEETKTPEYYQCTACASKFEKKKSKCGCKATIVSGPMKRKEIPFNPGSRQQIVEKLKGLGWSPIKHTDGGYPQLDESILESLPFPEAKLLSRYFLIQKRIGQLAEGKESWLKLSRRGRIHGEVITNRAVTGRCGHKSPNMAQVPRVGNPYGLECRSLFKASDGMVLVGADASGLELRCLAHYLFPFDGGKYVEVVTGPDVHTFNQKAFRLPAGKEGRNRSKTGIYAKVYGAGPEKIGSSLVQLEPDAEAEAQKLELHPAEVRKLKESGVCDDPIRLADYKRGRYAAAAVEKGIKGFDKLIGAIDSIVGNRMKRIAAKRSYLTGIDGRKLRIRSQHSALNTLLQSAGAVLVKKATVIWDKKLMSNGLTPGADCALVAHVHDEIQCECRPEIADKVGKWFVESISEAGASFNFKCPLTGEFKVGSNWADTH